MTSLFKTTLPTDIEKSLIDLHDNDRDIATMQTDLAAAKADIRSQVLAETVDGTPDGKPKYSNDATRGAAVAVAESQSLRVYEINRQLATTQTDRARILAAIERQKMEFKIHLLDRELEVAAYRGGAVVVSGSRPTDF